MAIVIKINDSIKKKVISFYKPYFREKTPPYAIFQANVAGTVITLYESGKLMFQGKNEKEDAAMWKNFDGIDNNKKNQKNEKKIKNTDYYNISSYGSDEVGTGDYFGPIVVSAAYVNKKDIPFLESLNVCDSKKLTDQKILEIVPKFIKTIMHKTIIMSPKEYNMYHNKGYNMNKIKAIMHNKALYDLINNNNMYYDLIIVDQFAPKKNYFTYLKERKKIIKNITFLTKAEDQNLAVAAASLISRYVFLKEFDKLSDKVKMPLLKGAGKNVDKQGIDLIKSYNKEILKDIAKISFKNTQKIINEL